MRCVALSWLNLDSDKITLRLSSNEKQFREQDDRTTLRFHSSNAASIIPVFSDQRNDYKPETLEKNNGKEPSSVDWSFKADKIKPMNYTRYKRAFLGMKTILWMILIREKDHDLSVPLLADINTLTATLVILWPATVSPVTPWWSLVTEALQLLTIVKIEWKSTVRAFSI